jgi:hypothetical protein
MRAINPKARTGKNGRVRAYLFFVVVSAGFLPLACGVGSTVSGTAVVTTIAGGNETTPPTAGSTDGAGTKALFFAPEGITTDGANLYVADTYNHTIRRIVIATGEVTTIAGTAGATGSTDGAGPSARFLYPYGIATDGTNLYVSDSSNHTIRKIVISTGAVTTIAGSAGDAGYANATGATARFNYPRGVAINGGNLYVADSYNNTVRQVVVATGVVTTLAGNPGGGSSDGVGATAQFLYPFGLATDGANIYVADTLNNTIRQIVILTGSVTTVAGTTGYPGSMDGMGTVLGTAAQFNHPRGLVAGGGNLYVVDSGNNKIRQIVIAGGMVTTMAGSGGGGPADGTGTGAQFFLPNGITTDGTNLYVADTMNNTIRKVH